MAGVLASATPSSFGDGLLPGQLLIWTPGAAFIRLRQLARIALLRPYRTGVRDWEIEPAIMDAADRCGIRHVHARTHTKRCVECPTCQNVGQYLIEQPRRRWGCATCTKHPQHPMLEVMLGDYVFAHRIGMRGKLLVRKHRRLTRALAQVARDARTPAELLRLSLAVPVMKLPLWERRVPHPLGGISLVMSGPMHKALAPHLVDAMVDSLIHPLAYMDRFAH